MTWAEAYLYAMFHLDPSKRLATIHQRYRQDRTDGLERQDNGPIAYGEPFYKRSPKNGKFSYHIRTFRVSFDSERI